MLFWYTSFYSTQLWVLTVFVKNTGPRLYEKVMQTEGSQTLRDHKPKCFEDTTILCMFLTCGIDNKRGFNYKSRKG